MSTRTRPSKPYWFRARRMKAAGVPDGLWIWCVIYCQTKRPASDRARSILRSALSVDGRNAWGGPWHFQYVSRGPDVRLISAGFRHYEHCFIEGAL